MSRFFSKQKQKSVIPTNNSSEVTKLKDLKLTLTEICTQASNFKKAFGNYSEGLTLLKANLLHTGTQVLSEITETVAHVPLAEVSDCLSSIEKKEKVLELLKTKLSKLENLSSSKAKLQKKISEYQKKRDFENVSKLSRELTNTNEEFKSLDIEVSSKVSYLKQNLTQLFSNEKSYLKFAQDKWMGNKKSSDIDSTLNLTDEFMKFEMSLEAKVVEEQRQRKSISPAKPPLERKPLPLKSVPVVYNTLVAQIPIVTDTDTTESVQHEHKYVAVYDYTPQQSDELELTEGDELKVTQQNDDGWYVGENTTTGKTGLFPGNYCEPLNTH